MENGGLVPYQPTAQVVRADHFMPLLDMEMAVARHNFMVEITKKLMVESTDYGVIPGTDKPTLLKPGAEKLCTLFGLSPEFILEEIIEDWSGKEHGGEPLFYYRYKARLTKNGIIIGEGIGSCNSWESKYRYRWLSEDRVPSNLDKSKLVKRGGAIAEPEFAIDKAETSGRYGKPAEYWQRFRSAIEAGIARRVQKPKKDGGTMPAWEIDSSEYRIPNPDIADIVNTVQKMAQKRALIAGVMIATNASEFFTQDLDDFQTIDLTPAHPAETQEQVRDRRIAEERQKAGPPGERPAAEDADELRQLLAKCTSTQGVQSVMATLGDRLATVLNDEQASTVEFNKLCSEQHVADWQKLLNSRDKAKSFIRAFYNRIEQIIEARKPPAPQEAA